MHLRSGLIAGVTALALAIAPALCCCVGMAAAAEDAGCGGQSHCDRDSAPLDAPAPDGCSCTDGRAWSMGPLPGAAASKAALSPGGGLAAAFEPATPRFTPRELDAAPTGQRARAGPVISLYTLKTLLLN